MAPESPLSPAHSPGVSSRRRLAFRLIAILAPFALVALAEVSLRLLGHHRPTEFWLPSRVSGELVPNSQFASRFVGPSFARLPRSIRVTESAPAETLRIIVFGESAALGDPEPAFGVGRCLQALLEARLPGRPVEVINTAITALNSHAILAAARDSRRLQADFWVIYAGNNEVVGPYGPANSDGPQPSLTTIRTVLRAGETALGQWLAEQRALKADGLSLTQRWAGLELFLDRPVAFSDPRLVTVTNFFARNLTDLVELGLDSGARVVLSTMAVNLADSAPFASADLTTNDPAYPRWHAAFESARQADERGDITEALQAWENAAAARSDHAETFYRLGQARMNTGDSAAAWADFERARDLDTLRFRADSRINEVTRQVARNLASARLLFVDAARDLRGLETNQPPGMNLFLEHVHLRPEGNYFLARLLAEPIVRSLGSPAGGTWLDLNACLARLGWNPFAEARLWSQTRALTQRPPFSHQSNGALRERYLDDRLVEANGAARRQGLASTAQTLQTVVNQHPSDWQLREQYARLLQLGRQGSNAAVQWRQIVDLAPGYVVGWYQLGESLTQAGDRPAAIRAYEQALEIRPDFVEARLGLGLALAESGQRERALQEIDEALRQSPKHLQARVNRGLLQIVSGKPDQGLADLRLAAQDNPSSILPLVRMAEVLSSQKEFSRAAEAYAEAAAREPNNAALPHRQAIELSRANRLTEAEAAFNRALQVDPNFVSAHLDLGVALAQRGRFQEAIPQFEAALRLQPTNAVAQSYLDRARQQLTQPAPSPKQ
ncbi:MAG: tetratricopeptide repeat protein [Verrucomicrobia bacterium]|nr:tetratricopeptide repeat protein [Verrucomicrobiota bacterium]